MAAGGIAGDACGLALPGNESWGANRTGNWSWHGGGSGGHDEAMYYVHQQMASFIYLYINPSHFFVGLVANLVSLLVFAGKSLRGLSSSIYVASALVADTALLFSLCMVWLESLGHNFNHLQGLCQISVFFSYVSSFLSAWYMVCITTENYITICHPTRIRVLCTARRARLTVMSVAVLSCLLYSYSLVITGPIPHPSGRRFCSTKPPFKQLETMLSYADSIITLLLPSAAMVLMLACIVVAIAKSLSAKQRRRIKSAPRQPASQHCPQVRVAKMLFVLSLTYLVLNLPSHTLRLYLALRPEIPCRPEITYHEGILLLWFHQISYLSCNTKFFIFVAFSANFRKSLRQQLRCLTSLCVRSHQSTTVPTTHV